MRHTASLSHQLPIAAHIASVLLYNPPATADVQKHLLATDRKVLDHRRVIKPLAFHPYIRTFIGNLIFLFQINHYFRAAFLHIRNAGIIQCPFRKRETIAVGFHSILFFVLSSKDTIFLNFPSDFYVDPSILHPST